MTDETAQDAETDALLPTPPQALMARLDAMGIPYVLHRHKPVFTCEESAFLKDVIPGLHVKNLFLRDKKGRMCLVVVPDELALDLKILAPVLGFDRFSFGSPERLWTHLGVRPGSVCPFAAINDTDGAVEVVLHRPVAEAPVISAHPMHNTMSLALSGPDVVRFLAAVNHPPRILDLAPYARAAA
ncbi:MAG: prolyl-tRNA synthetase associated domain-containing protein [Rhodospirillales bacterium]|nr:prolyl-tRNA synthetase associated domain-containing protein [Alphaproteobacteria bacterium]MCB9986645.1 prolyl-tRNA synthetase associated domain-containing protein [Rhodospirillales bacterium]USO06827.1 MAG: prolyl-tRNA synthetase associated domain-containing protein [Rhodospirillales bacterium]